MQVTDTMIEAAIKKAVEAGWMPRNAMLIIHNGHNWKIMRGLLQTAIDAMPINGVQLKSTQSQVGDDQHHQF